MQLTTFHNLVPREVGMRQIPNTVCIQVSCEDSVSVSGNESHIVTDGSLALLWFRMNGVSGNRAGTIPRGGQSSDLQD